MQTVGAWNRQGHWGCLLSDFDATAFLAVVLGREREKRVDIGRGIEGMVLFVGLVVLLR